MYDGIKAVDRAAPVLVGNIATDWESKNGRVRLKLTTSPVYIVHPADREP